MRGDFSRNTFDPKKHYTGVWMQQGRVQLDADWNEQQAINRHRLEAEARDVIGGCGAPFSDPGFEIKVDDLNNLLIGCGRYYVDGILCLNEKDDLKYQEQPDLPSAPNIADLLKLNEPSTPRHGIVYLDVWQRGITSLDDPNIKETALGGADTATRTKAIWQVKVHPLQEMPSPPYSDIKLFRENKVALSAWASSEGDISTDPCIIRPSAGYRRLENQLYRIEIHKSGKLDEATFKWSRDNGSTEMPIDNDIKSKKVTVQNIGPGVIDVFNDGTWVEVVDDNSELNPQGGQPRNLVQLRKDKNDAINVFTLEDDLSWLGDKIEHARLRKWESKDIPVRDGPITLGDVGIDVKFSAEDISDEFKSGDYWLIPARIATGDIEWPKVGKESKPQPPLGIEHHYCNLAVVSFDGSKLRVLPDSDCRIIFPPLTGIKASNISFDNKICQLASAETVQAALEDLCKRDEGSCSLYIKPGWGWEKDLEKIGDGEDASICLKAGVYPLKSTVTLKKKGHIKIIGSGAGTKIVISSAEVALNFDSCNSVTVKDLYAESGVAGFWHGAGLSHLNGTLTFSACPKVTVERVMLKCAAGAEKAATCLTVRDTAEYEPVRPVRRQPVELVRISNCDLGIGYQQIGMLLIEVSRVQIEGNVLEASPRPTTLHLNTLVQNYAYRSMIRHLMVNHAHFGENTSDSDIINLSAGKGKIWFKTHPLLKSVWPELFKSIPCKGVQNDKDLLLHVKKIAERALLNRGSILDGEREIFGGFRPWYRILEGSLAATASQGIVVIGASGSGDLNIINNKIGRVLDGIHVTGKGTSIFGDRRSSLGCPVVHILGNNIEVWLSPTSRQRNGIFIGDSSSLIVENNYIKIKRFPATDRIQLEGIRIHGNLGDMAIVRQNHIADQATIAKGVTFTSLQEQQSRQWIVADNWPSNVIRPA